MESYTNRINNIIDELVSEAINNSETYNEAKMFVNKNVEPNNLGLTIKNIAHDKIEEIAMNDKIREKYL